ncbi:MAG: hypothetical protein J0H25_07875, partial [Rhizobiales bacterium]|nr:hypothetical protein [Hyphomicrobiales bacterium]
GGGAPAASARNRVGTQHRQSPPNNAARRDKVLSAAKSITPESNSGPAAPDAYFGRRLYFSAARFQAP